MGYRIAMFNHKGGVSKTTSVYNIGWMLSKMYNVLVVDMDPQCNLSALILGDNFEKYYIDEATRFQNIKDGVKVAFEGKPQPISAVSCFSPAKAPQLYLLAGHADLSGYEGALSFAQTARNAIATLQNLPGSFSRLLELTEQKYNIDFTIIDMNPSLSAINQNAFILSDAFILPTNPDPFSVMAITTLSRILPTWVSWSQECNQLFSDSAYPLPNVIPKFLGSLIQRFNVRNGRAAKPYRDNISEIKDQISGVFFASLSKKGMVLDDYPQEIKLNQFCLDEIPDFQGLLPKAYDAGVPIFDLTEDDIKETGPVLTGMIQKRNMFLSQFSDLVEKIVSLLKLL